MPAGTPWLSGAQASPAASGCCCGPLPATLPQAVMGQPRLLVWLLRPWTHDLSSLPKGTELG